MLRRRWKKRTASLHSECSGAEQDHAPKHCPALILFDFLCPVPFPDLYPFPDHEANCHQQEENLTISVLLT
jgi:hypothetical protein